MRLTISGAVGSGKSTVARLLCKQRGYTFYSVGEFMRQIAKKRRLTIMELSKLAETDATIDEELDEKQRLVGETDDDFVMDSRLGFYFIPESYKIFLDVDVKEAARRIYEQRRDEERYASLQEAEDYVKKRMRSENVRYKEYYGIDFPRKGDFDLVIDTTGKSPDQVVDDIEKAL